jgi:single-stranded-DNA-specific exonuclease
MQYILIGDNKLTNIKQTILQNRGVKDIDNYLNLNSKSLHSYSMLNNIDKGIKLLQDAIDNNLSIYIVVDSDPDGYTSASILYHYIKTNIKYNNITYILQTGKQHGLSEDVLNQLKISQIGLIILPDSGTNDNKQCKLLNDLGFNILILDHHQQEIENESAIIVNNQTCDYPNKNLCGAGIVYKFLQALDDEYWLSNADNYIDFVSLGNISDVMDLRECETKYIVDVGLKNISHPLLTALIKKQSFSIKNTEYPTITEISFYITPLINALIRTGIQEEKELLFKACIMEYEEFEYTPRKSKTNPEPTLTIESIYDRVARLCYNAKSKQTKLQSKAVEEIINLYDDQNRNNSICFINASKLENVSKELTGLAAIKIASEYDKPCLILRKDKIKSAQDNIIFSGSARNVNDGFIEDLKTELESSDLFEELVGHANAFGVSIKKQNIPLAIEYFNEKYKDISKTKIYKVDFILDGNIEYKIIKDIFSIHHLFSSFVKEPLIAINNVNIDLLGFSIMGNDSKKHWKFQNDVVEYIRFNVPEDDELLNIDTFTYSNVIINVIGKANINVYGSKTTPQFIIEDYEIISKY